MWLPSIVFRNINELPQASAWRGGGGRAGVAGPTQSRARPHAPPPPAAAPRHSPQGRVQPYYITVTDEGTVSFRVETRADFYTALDKENCADGFRWREGDALNAAIGQGDTGVTPLQMAMVYSSIANGGTVYQPRVVKGIIGPEGKVVQEFAPVVKSKVDTPKSAIKFLQQTLPSVTTQGTGETPFQGFPLDQIPVASKTGSAQVTGSKVSTSWFASYAPANNPKYAVVMMVTQGGTGSKTSGPSVRKIYEGLFGIHGRSVNSANSVLVGGQPRAELPKVRPDGTPVVLKGKQSGVQ